MMLQVKVISICFLLGIIQPAIGQIANDLTVTEDRLGFLIDVPLPIFDDRDEQIRKQLKQVIDRNRGEQRPVVVLRFLAKSVRGTEQTESTIASTRGSQFERCLSLARYLTGPEASRARLIAYVPAVVEGHAVLPILACEEILAAPSAEIGRAAIDEPLVDDTVRSAYMNVVQRRATLPTAVVSAMLENNVEVHQLELVDGQSLTAVQGEVEQLRKVGKILRDETIWPGGGLASFTGQQLRSQRWIARTVSDPGELASIVGVSRALQKVRQLPSEWTASQLTLSGEVDSDRINQIIRAVGEQVQLHKANLLIVKVSPSQVGFTDATRLADYLSDLGQSKVATLGLIEGEVVGPASLVALSCDEVIVIDGSSLQPDLNLGRSVDLNARTTQLALAAIEERTGRPAALLSVPLNSEISVKEFIDQETGRRALWANWQTSPDPKHWLPKDTVAGGDAVDLQLAERYGLVDGTAASYELALHNYNVKTIPTEVDLPWLDAGLQKLLSNSWIPRLLLTVGFLALISELGAPGLGAGAFISALCFIGYFWIEALNGNVEWLEVLLFVGGLIALAIELFVLPGFGVFGVGGLIMVLVSVVLASQTFVWPSNSTQLHEVSMNLFWVACLAMCGMVALLFMHKNLERAPMLRWLMLKPSEDADLDEITQRESLVHWEHLVGQEGLTTTRLNPSGKARFGGDLVAVIGTGKMIDEGTPVRVVEVRGNMVLVEELTESVDS